MINEKKVKEGIFIIVLATLLISLLKLANVFEPQVVFFAWILSVAVLLGSFMLLMLFVFKSASALILVLESIIILWILNGIFLQAGFNLISLILDIIIVFVAYFLVNKLRLAR